MAKTIKLNISGSDTFSVDTDLKVGQQYVVIARGTCVHVGKKHTKSGGEQQVRTIALEVAMMPEGADANELMEQLANVTVEREGGEQQPMPLVD